MTSTIRAAVLAALLGLAAALPAAAQFSRSTPGQPEARVVQELMPAKARLTVSSPAFKAGGLIPFANTQYRTNTFPGLAWSKGPPGTKSYVVIMQDNAVIYQGAPILHWTLFNIPASVTRLPAAMAPDAKPAGSSYGPNIVGPAHAYWGPRAPPGPGNTYHFQVFALDTTLPAEAAGDFAAMTRGMAGHILASGKVMAHSIADPAAPPAPPAK